MIDPDNEWQAFKQRLGNGDFAAGVQAVEAALAQFQERCGSALFSLVLFGSFARGSRQYDDIELLIVTQDSLGPVDRVTQVLAEEIFGPLFLDYGQLFSFLVYSRAQVKELKILSPLFDEIARDGILLYGQNPFA